MFWKQTLSGVMAGLLVTMGCTVYLACESVYAGAALFCVALVCICFKGLSLFTGKVGYLAESHTKADWTAVLTALLGNFLGMWLFGTLIRIGLPHLTERAATLCTAKLSQSLVQALIRGFFCGILMYLAVSIYREKKSIVAIFLCVPAFILSGFEHSIADMGYFAIAGIVDGRAFVFTWVVILGNALGGMCLPFLNRLTKMEG